MSSVVYTICGYMFMFTFNRDSGVLYIKTIYNNQFYEGALPIEEFNTYFSTTFSDAQFDTMGGLVMHAFGYLPKRNEKIQMADFEFKVLSADHRRIRLLQVRLIT